jgi:hypothetical protein
MVHCKIARFATYRFVERHLLAKSAIMDGTKIKLWPMDQNRKYMDRIRKRQIIR